MVLRNTQFPPALLLTFSSFSLLISSHRPLPAVKDPSMSVKSQKIKVLQGQLQQIYFDPVFCYEILKFQYLGEILSFTTNNVSTQL